MTPAQAIDALKSWRPHPHTTHHDHCACRYEEAERLSSAAIRLAEAVVASNLEVCFKEAHEYRAIRDCAKPGETK